MEVNGNISMKFSIDDNEIEKIVLTYLKKLYEIDDSKILENGFAWDYFTSWHNGEIVFTKKREQTKNEQEYVTVLKRIKEAKQ